MDNNNHPIAAGFSACVSLCSALYAVITLEQVQAYLTMSASIIAVLSGVFAIRYYWIATNKIKSK